MKTKDKLEKYKEFETENYRVKNTIGTPHPYTITNKHIEHSSGMYLDPIEAESKGAKCGHPGCHLSYKEHEEALVVEINNHQDKKLKDIPGLNDYLLKLKPICEADGFAGFAFVKGTK